MQISTEETEERIYLIERKEEGVVDLVARGSWQELLRKEEGDLPPRKSATVHKPMPPVDDDDREDKTLAGARRENGEEVLGQGSRKRCGTN